MNFDQNVSNEELYVSVGEVIGHEISHAFDQIGSLFDKDGNYNSNGWWTAEDYVAFKEKNNKLIEYLNTQIHPWEGLQMNGELMAGEVCADMGGRKVMLMMASQRPDFDYDLFIRSYASHMLYEYNEKYLDLYMNDEHPQAYIRVNLTLQQYDEFLDFYGITEGDGMYLAPKDRIAIW